MTQTQLNRRSVAPDPIHSTHSLTESVGGARTLGTPPPCYVFVGSSPISEAMIAHEMQQHRAADPHISRAAAARALVVRELLRLEAERLGIAGQAAPAGEETREEAVIRVLLEREISTPEPGGDACRRYYENNRHRLHHPDRFRVRHILLAASPHDSAARLDARALGERLVTQLRANPERFVEFAQRHSACPSREQGGELDWIAHGDTTPEFERQVFRLPCGLAGLTVETRYGHHVVDVQEIQRGRPLTFAEAEGRVARYLETQTKQNAIHDYLTMLAGRYGVRGLDETEAATGPHAGATHEAPSSGTPLP